MKVTLCEGKHLRFVQRDGWEYVERTRASGIVVVVAITQDQRLILTEQYRRPVDNHVIELPAGLAGDTAAVEAEEPIAAAHRELREETGYEAEDFEFLFRGPPSAGATSEVITFFRATGLRRVGDGDGDSSEAIEVHHVPLATARHWLQEKERAGVLVDPKVYAGLYFALCGDV